MDTLIDTFGAPVLAALTALTAALVLTVVGLAYWILDSRQTKRKRRNMRPNRTIQSTRTSKQPQGSDTNPDDSAYSFWATNPNRPLMTYLM